MDVWMDERHRMWAGKHPCIDTNSMVRTNFREGIQGLSLSFLTETMLPEEVELLLASLRREAKNEDLQIYWPA
jgi:hypothetical protein